MPRVSQRECCAEHLACELRHDESGGGVGALLLEHVEKRLGVIECVDHMGPIKGQRNPERGQNWTWELKVSPAKALAAIEKEGLDLDADLTPKN